MQIKKAGDALGGSVKGKILIYGQSGSGKSWLGVTAPSPLVLLTEKNGFASIAHSNPEAKVIECDKIEDIYAAIRAIKSGEISEFETLVIDSLTNAQTMIKSRILSRSGKKRLQIQDWGDLAGETLSLIETLRSLDCHVVCIALRDDELVSESGRRYTYPLFEGKKTKNNISQFFNVIGYLSRETGDKGISRTLLFDGDESILCKPCFPLPAHVPNPDLSQIIKSMTATGEELEDPFWEFIDEHGGIELVREWAKAKTDIPVEDWDDRFKARFTDGVLNGDIDLGES
tara:strand:+ start:315 stop:1175 length:861 start_codon:yes stop_codon:yes gene_type:complete